MEGFFLKKNPQTKTKNPQPHHHHETKVLQHSNTFKYQLLLKGKGMEAYFACHCKSLNSSEKLSRETRVSVPWEMHTTKKYH